VNGVRRETEDEMNERCERGEIRTINEQMNERERCFFSLLNEKRKEII
jgi:uncharacterized protein (UPF0216 family)